MKKLIAMIGAVATAFGLYAADPYAISFESAEGCTQGEALNKTEWTVPEGSTATVVERTLNYNYQTSGDARRADQFEDTNDNSLKLETGKGTVVCTPGNVVDGIFFDQVVKFTGYEEPPTVEGGKIAVYMTAIETEGTEGEEGYQAGETNMYITCGTIDVTGKIDSKTIDLGAYDIDATHRVTIKSLGTVTEGGVAGFIVYIDGAQVVKTEAEGIVAEAQILPAFSSYNASGMLFPALVAGEVATLAYQGIGELDDIAVDELGPEFARFVEGTVAQIPGALLKVTDETGKEIEVKDNKFQAAPGAAITLTYTAANGKFLSINGKQEVVYAEHISQDHKDFTGYAEGVEVKTAVATYTDENYDYLMAESLQVALNNDQMGEVALLIDETLTNTLVVPDTFSGEINLGNKAITLAANAKIGIDIKGDYVTIKNGAIDSALTANVAGSKAINVPNKNVDLKSVTIDAAHYEYAIYANCDDDCVAAGDDLAWFYTDTEDKFATLACDVVSITGNGSLFHVEGMVANLKDCSATRDENELFGASHQAAVYSSLNSLTTISGSGTYTHVNALQSGNLGGKIIVAEEATATFTGDIKSWMQVGAHDELKVYDDYVAQFTFNAGTYAGNIVFVDATARELDQFQKADAVTTLAAPAGFKWDETTGILVPCDYVCEIGDNKYESFTEAWNEAKSGDTITLLADIPNAIGVTSEGKGAGFTLTIDFNGKKYTVNKPGAGSPNTRTLAFQLVEGGTFVFKNGTIECSAENKSMTWAKTDAEKGIAMIIQNYANLTLEGMTIDGSNIARNNKANCWVMSNNSGAVVIENTTIKANSGDYAFDTCKYSNSAHDYPAPTVEVKGTSVIDGDVELSGGNLTLTAGTLNGVLVASAIGNGVIQKAAGFTAEPPAGYQWNPTTGVLEPIPAGITINVTLGTGIASVTVDDQVLTASGEVTLDEAGEVTITLAADSTFTIPVFKVAQGAFGANVTPKTETYIVADGDTFTFTVEEAKADDPQVTEEQKKAAIIDAIDAGESHDAAVAKVNAVVTTETTPAEGKVTATELAGWIKDNGIHSADLAACDYVVASVKLGTDAPITTETPVKVATVDKTSSDLAVTIQVGGKDATKEQIESFVQVCDDLGAANDWEKLPQSELKSAVKIEAGKLVITPVAGVDKLFLKVVIPQDAK